jgi:CHRD domain-containing protein
MRRLSVFVLGVATLAIGVGVAFAGGGDRDATAQDYGGGGHKKGQSGDRQGKKWRAFKDLETSHVAVTAYLTGRAEVDDEGQDGAGDPNGKGTATFFVTDERTVCYGFAVDGIEPPTAAHIHKGVAGSNGDVVIDFTKGVPKDATGQPAGDPGASGGCKTLEAQPEVAALRRILSNPKGYYVNVHTASFEDGAVRGQLSRMLYDND